jgi:F-type H+-transporting ATPase subunit b
METETEEAAENLGQAAESAADGEHAGEHGAETLADGGHGAEATGMPQLDAGIYPNLIFWLLLSLIAIYFILTRIAIPRIGTIIAERNDAIANDLEQAALYKRRAEEAEAAYNAALAQARDESQRIAAETKAQISRDLSGLMAKADAEIAVKSADSEKRIVEIRESAVRSVEEVARETAGAIVQALMPSAADDAAVDAAVSGRLKG